VLALILEEIAIDTQQVRYHSWIIFWPKTRRFRKVLAQSFNHTKALLRWRILFAFVVFFCMLVPTYFTRGNQQDFHKRFLGLIIWGDTYFIRSSYTSNFLNINSMRINSKTYTSQMRVSKNMLLVQDPMSKKKLSRGLVDPQHLTFLNFPPRSSELE
jgi:hypothetical protein